MSRSIHPERHYSSRNNWLRAGVLGANDGLISTSALLMGLTGASTGRGALVIAGLSALVAGALSMAAGEFVSVSSQADTERADLDKERRELDRNPEAELGELASIYESRGLTPALARQVAEALTRHNDLEAHARDEIGLSETIDTNPLRPPGPRHWPSSAAPSCRCWWSSPRPTMPCCRPCAPARWPDWPGWAGCRPASAAHRPAAPYSGCCSGASWRWGSAIWQAKGLQV